MKLSVLCTDCSACKLADVCMQSSSEHCSNVPFNARLTVASFQSKWWVKIGDGMNVRWKSVFLPLWSTNSCGLSCCEGTFSTVSNRSGFPPYTQKENLLQFTHNQRRGKFFSIRNKRLTVWWLLPWSCSKGCYHYAHGMEHYLTLTFKWDTSKKRVVSLELTVPSEDWLEEATKWKRAKHEGLVLSDGSDM